MPVVRYGLRPTHHERISKTYELFCNCAILKNMKRLICLFLILWLPLFTGAALAMGTQMQVANELQKIEKAASSPCHDMQHMDSQKPISRHCNGNCFACGVCAFSCNVTGFMTTTFYAVFAPVTVSPTPSLIDLVFSSQLYPPALKPPISA